MQRRQSPILHRPRCPALLVLRRYYVATDRFYNGNLARNARQIELPPEVAAHLHPPQGPQGRTLQHGAANLRKAKRASIAECPKVVPLGADLPSKPSLPSRAGNANANANGNGDGDAKPAPPKPALRKMTTAIPRAARAAAEVGT